MKRRIFTNLSAVSLLFAVAVAVLWVRSYWVTDTLFLHISRFSIEVYSRYRGDFGVMWGSWRNSAPLGIGWRSEDFPNVWPSIDYRAYFFGPTMGLRLKRGPASAIVLAPMWPALLLCVLPTIIWIWRRRKTERGLHTCLSCGYDLRASKDKCPECGAAVTPKVT